MMWVLRICIALFLSGVAYIRTDGFSPLLIQGPLFSTNSPLTSEGEMALRQPFQYLGKGRQCFVFESKDGKYVLKFFNQSYLRTQKRRQFYENSYAIAFREFGDQILYLHLGPSRCLPTLSVTNKAQTHFELDLNQIPFVLQRKGIPFYVSLATIYEKEGLDGLKREIDSYLMAVSMRISKKIADWDQNVEDNWGYVEGKLFHLDPGRLYYDETLSEEIRIQLEWDRAMRKFHKWLAAHYPEGAQYLRNRQANALHLCGF